MNTRPPRISATLKDEIGIYLVEKESERQNGIYITHDRNDQKLATFRLIQFHVKANTLTADVLTDILAGLTPLQTKHLFAVGVFKDTASVESNAAKLIAALFAELAYPLNESDLEKIVQGGLSKSDDNANEQAVIEFKKMRFRQIVRSFRANAYDELARNRLDHELWGRVNKNNIDDLIEVIRKAENEKSRNDILRQSFVEDKSLATFLFERISSNKEVDLVELQKLCPEYMPELLAELTKKMQHAGLYKDFLEKVLLIVKRDEHPELIHAFLNASYQLTLDIVKENREKYLELDSSMQAKVHSDLMLDVKSNIEILDAIYEFAANTRKYFGYTVDSKSQHEYKFDVSKSVSSVSSVSSTSTTSTTTTSSVESTDVSRSKTISMGEIEDVSQFVADGKDEVDVLYHAIKEYQPDVDNDYKRSVIEAIKNQHEKTTIATKKNFFTALLERSNGGENITVDLLQQLLTGVDLAELFKRWGGFGAREDSHTAELITWLYRMATGVELTAKEITTMVNEGTLPTMEEKVKQEIKKVILNPAQKLTDKLGKLISVKRNELHNANAVLARVDADKLAHTEAEYQDRIVQIGLENAAQSNQVCFDTQGRVFLQIIDDQHRKLVNCSLDIKNHDLRKSFIAWVVNESPDESLSAAANALFELPSRSSILPLHEEMEMHIRLISRMLQQHELDDSDGKITKNATLRINRKVRDVFQLALQHDGVYDSNKIPEINIDKLNAELAKARKDLAFFAKRVLLEEYMKPDGYSQPVKVENIEHTLNLIEEKSFRCITATGFDYVRTDVDLESCMRVAGTYGTSHNKLVFKQKKQELFPFREIHRTVYKGDRVKKADRIQIDSRVPSIAFKYEDHDVGVQDVVKKLAYGYETMQKTLGGYDGPMTYNLLTALHFDFIDITADITNRQRKSAAIILKGAHAFNRQQILEGKPNSLWFVENISVNQQGIHMGYDRWDNVTVEATLMSEIAMLSNFVTYKSCLPPEMRNYVQNVYDSIYSSYNTFLQNNEQGDLYFKDSEEGKRAIRLLENFKINVANNDVALTSNADEPMVEVAMKVLMKTMAMNKHWKKSYGPLVQALSVFIETASQHGCKSANEREALISNQVELLKAFERNGETNLGKNVIEAMHAYLNVSQDDKENLRKVRNELNKALNDSNLYGLVVSHEDQGASFKLETSKPCMFLGMDLNPASVGKLGFFDTRSNNIFANTNKAVPRDFTNLHAEHASAMQSHKGEYVTELKRALAEIAVDNKPVNRL